MPELNAVAAELAPRGLDLVTVMVDGTPGQAARVVDKTHLAAPVVLGDDELRVRFNVQAYPWTIILGRDGRALKALRGGRSGAEFKREFERYLVD